MDKDGSCGTGAEIFVPSISNRADPTLGTCSMANRNSNIAVLQVLTAGSCLVGLMELSNTQCNRPLCIVKHRGACPIRAVDRYSHCMFATKRRCKTVKYCSAHSTTNSVGQTPACLPSFATVTLMLYKHRASICTTRHGYWVTKSQPIGDTTIRCQRQRTRKTEAGRPKDGLRMTRSWE